MMTRIFSGFLFLALLIAAPVSHAETRLPPVSMINVFKAQRLMVLSDQMGRPVKTYKIALGKSPVGQKRKEGDKKTPEGRYYIQERNPNSNYHLSLKISYPNDEDWTRAEEMGHSPGGLIMIHGLPNDKPWLKDVHRQKDWTDGCIAVNNEEIEEIWQIVQDGTPIQIWP